MNQPNKESNVFVVENIDVSDFEGLEIEEIEISGDDIVFEAPKSA